MNKRSLSPPDLKRLTQGQSIKPLPIAPGSELIFPLLQHTGAACQPKVSLGDQVKPGGLIADNQTYLSSPIHSSISGEVQAIEDRPHPTLGHYKAIVIKSVEQDSIEAATEDRENVGLLSAEKIRRIIRDCGIVGLGGAAFPTHVKLAPPKDKPIDTFIVNGAECEPYLTADHQLMLEKSQEIISGVKIAMKALGVTYGFVVVEENKPGAIHLLRRIVDGKLIKVVGLKSFYPQGAEKQLIQAVLNRQVPPGGLPFDVGVVVNNVATCFAIYEAVYKKKPLYERVITVSGKIVKEPGNFKVRLGVKIKDIIESCGGLNEQPAKIILGGPMMGLAQYTLDVPVIKGTSGIIVFSEKQARIHPSRACIRCGRCLQVCPMGLNPSAIARAIEKGRFDLAQEYNVLDCIECGICSYGCPGNSNVVALVQLAKHKLAQRENKVASNK